MERRDGFVGQRMTVVPQPLVAQALEEPVTRRLLVTDAGYFPHAEGHLRIRARGIAEGIVILCTRGGGWVELRGRRWRLAPGTAAFIPADVPHSYGAHRETPWTIWWCHLAGTAVTDLWQAAEVSADQPFIQLGTLDRVTVIFDELVSALERDHTPARLLVAAGLAWRLVTQMAVSRRLTDNAEPLERAMRYIRERVDGTIRVPELARLVGVSPSHLGALFREATGGGVLAYHTSIRMARARTLLDTTTLGISQIAREVGFSDPLYFSRQFRRIHGVSPTSYREYRDA